MPYKSSCPIYPNPIVMKNHSTPTSLLILLTFLLEFTCLHSLLSQNHLYGTTADQYFTRVIPDAQGLYILGQENGIATITHIDPNGNWDWTHMLNTASLLTDGIVQPNNDLLFIGMTLPFNSTNKSIIGEISSGGVFGCLNIIDQPGLEGLSRIDFNGTNYSAVGIQTQAGSLQDVILLELNSPCNIVNKKYFLSAAVDDFAHDIAIIGNDLYVAGKVSNRAIIYHHSLSNSGFIDGVQMPANYTYADLHEYGTDLLAIANPVGSGQPHLMRFDANLFLQWEVDLFGVSSLQQIVEQGGDIYVIGTATISGLPRSVIIKIDDSTGPQLVWAKYLDDNETGYIGGAIALLPTGNIVYVDGRAHPSGYGLQDAFLAITDGDLTTVCTESITLDMSNELTLFESPVGLVLEFYDTPPLMADIAPEITWESRGMCGTADPIDTCICPTPEMVLTQNGNDYFLACLPHGSPTPVLSCPVGPVTISGFYGCVDQNTGEPCEEESNVTWTLTGPGGAIDGGSTTNYPAFLFPSSHFQTNGTYTLTLTTVCPNSADTCVCILDWIVECDSCCTDYDLFCQAVMNAVSVTVDNALCKVTVNINNLPDCDYIKDIDWHDPSPTQQGPFGNGDMIMHTYAQSGTYILSYTGIEIDPDTGLPCFEKHFKDTVTVDCEPASLFKCGMAVTTYYSISNPMQQVLSVRDVRNHCPQPQLTNWLAPEITFPDWDVSHLGEIFGIAIDKFNNIYVCATSAYATSWPTTLAYGPAGSGGIYKINATTGNITTFVSTAACCGSTMNTATIPNARAGLGNIAYDEANNVFFVTNLEDGKIYRIDATTGIINSTYDPFLPDNGTAGLACEGERIWGIGRYGSKLYFSQCNQSSSVSVGPNKIYSITLGPLGTFPPSGSEVLEITLPPISTTYLYSNPVSDIEFAADGRMIVAEHTESGLACQPLVIAHGARALEYTGAPGPLTLSPNTYFIGVPNYNNSAGGADFGYKCYDPATQNPGNCDEMIWVSGDALILSAPVYCYGIAGIPAGGNSTSSLNSWFVDVDSNLGPGDKTRIGDVDIIDCGCLSEGSVCDSISVTSSPVQTENDTCCFTLTVENHEPNYFTGIALCTQNGVSLSSVSALNGWIIAGYSANLVSLTPSSPFAATGTQPFIDFCLSNYQNVPNQQVIVKYYGPDFEVVCMDTLNYQCSQKPKCLQIVNDTVSCLPNGQYKLDFCIMADPLIGFTTSSFQLNPPTGITFTPSAFPVTPGLTAGQTRCTFSTIVSGALDGQTICFSVTGHKQNITTGESPLECCTDTVMTACVTMPACVCNQVSATATYIPSMSDTCCWQINLQNAYSNSYFTGITLDIITPGVIFGAIKNTIGSGWSLSYLPSQATFMKIPPGGSFIGSSAILPEFCLSGIYAPFQVPQTIIISWLGPNKEVICMDTLFFDCSPPETVPCAELIEPIVACTDIPGVYDFTFSVKNNTGFSINQVVLNNLTPPNSINPSLYNIPLLNPNGTSGQIAASMFGSPGTLVCFNLTLHQLSPDSLELNCCTNTNQYCFTLPECDSCSCAGFSNLAFTSERLPGWKLDATCNNATPYLLPCLPMGGAYEFEGEMPCLDTCGSEIEYEIASETGTSLIIGTVGIAGIPNQFHIPPFNYTLFPAPGNYELRLRGFCGFDTCECVIRFTIQACASLLHGVVYADLECEAKDYSDQPTLPGWSLTLLDEMGNERDSTITNAAGAFTFTNVPQGQYTLRTELQPKWEYSVPDDGTRSFTVQPKDTLPEPRSIFLPFGLCSVCSCNDLTTSLSNYDECCYYLEVQNNGAYCYTEITITLDAGAFANVTANGWTAIQTNSSQLRLLPPGGYIAVGQSFPVHFCLDGNQTPTITIKSIYTDSGNKFTCTNQISTSCLQDCSYSCEDHTTWQATQNIFNEAYAMVEFNGKLIIGGVFNQVGSLTGFNNIAAWDGATFSKLGTGFPSGNIFALAVHNGTLYAGGRFSSPAGNIAAWDPITSTWLSLDGGVGVNAPGVNGTVRALLSTANGLVAGGYFNAAGLINPLLNTHNIAIWDPGTLKWMDNLGGGITSASYNEVFSLCLYKGQIVAGGFFYNSSYSNIAIWDNQSWSNLGGGINGQVYALKQYGNKLCAGGAFSNASYVPDTRHIALWDGSQWESMGGGVPTILYSGPGEIINCLEIYNGKLYAGGRFLQIGTTNANAVAEWDETNQTWKSTNHFFEFIYTLGTYDEPGDFCTLYSAGYGAGPAPLRKWTCFPVSTEEPHDLGITIFPNPTSANLTVDLGDHHASEPVVRIFNLTGQLVIQEKSESNLTRLSIDTYALLPGIYFLQIIENGKSIAVDRFIKL